MNAAMYIAKVIQQDLVWSNASAWQWWLAVSPYDYKDGLVYVDKNKTDGNYYDSKMFWALGNYSRFIRPGMIRVNHPSMIMTCLFPALKTMSGKLVLVIVNLVAIDKPLTLKRQTHGFPITLIPIQPMNRKTLKKAQLKQVILVVPARSVMTVIVD